MNRIVKSLLSWFKQHKIDSQLSSIIRGRRVLVLGSGPSVSLLREIPEDVLVFSCNFGPSILLENNLIPHVDVYICTRKILTDLSYLKKIERLLSNIDIRFFIFGKPQFIQAQTSITNYTALLPNESIRGRFMRTLVGKNNTKRIREAGKISNGLHLIEYALFYGAKEVYLSGIDLRANGYGVDSAESNNKIYITAHQDADHIYIDCLAERFSSLFVTHKESPLHPLLPQKQL